MFQGTSGNFNFLGHLDVYINFEITIRQAAACKIWLRMVCLRQRSRPWSPMGWLEDIFDLPMLSVHPHIPRLNKNPRKSQKNPQKSTTFHLHKSDAKQSDRFDLWIVGECFCLDPSILSQHLRGNVTDWMRGVSYSPFSCRKWQQALYSFAWKVANPRSNHELDTIILHWPLAVPVKHVRPKCAPQGLAWRAWCQGGWPNRYHLSDSPAASAPKWGSLTVSHYSMC